MTSWILLGKTAMLGSGFLAATATLGSLTAPPPQRDEPALVRHWGEVVLVGPESAPSAVARGTSEQAPFRVGPARAVPECLDDEDTAVAQASQPSAEAAPGQVPSPDEIGRAMHALLPAVQRCYDTGMVPGRIELTLVVSGQTGRVLDSSVSDGSSTGRCLQQLGQRVRFKPFGQGRFTLRWPFSFR
jgi:hypothetical protein